MIAALFVETDGPYFGLENVDPWDAARDARAYSGPHPVIAHPPCKRWGRYWSGGPSATVRRLKGDDGGCFAAALWSVRTFGGVLEHPADTHAWPWFGLPKPDRGGGWTQPDRYGGRACHVEQGHYGHKARKATWLYLVGDPSEMIWGPSTARGKIDLSPRSKAHAIQIRTSPGYVPTKKLSQAERLLTPLEFRDALIRLVAGITAPPI